jgi:hypothetical protein
VSPERNFSHILDEALAQQKAGHVVPDILAQFPKYADRLSPLLQKARQISTTSIPTPPAGAQAASKARMMAALGKIKANGAQHKEEVVDDLGAGLHKKPGRGLVVFILALVILFILLSTINVAAFYALPGSWLYPAKITIQEAHILIAFDPEVKAERIDFYNQIRLNELTRAVELGRFSAQDAQATMTAMPTPHATPIPTPTK